MVKEYQDYIPSPGYLLTIPLEDEGIETPEGFTIEGEDEMPQFAKVIAVGKETYNQYTDRIIKSPCKVGNIIIHSSHGWEHIKLKAKKYRIVPFNVVLMVKK